MGEKGNIEKSPGQEKATAARGRGIVGRSSGVWGALCNGQKGGREERSRKHARSGDLEPYGSMDRGGLVPPLEKRKPSVRGMMERVEVGEG